MALKKKNRLHLEQILKIKVRYNIAHKESPIGSPLFVSASAKLGTRPQLVKQEPPPYHSANSPSSSNIPNSLLVSSSTVSVGMECQVCAYNIPFKPNYLAQIYANEAAKTAHVRQHLEVDLNLTEEGNEAEYFDQMTIQWKACFPPDGGHLSSSSSEAVDEINTDSPDMVDLIYGSDDSVAENVNVRTTREREISGDSGSSSKDSQDSGVDFGIAAAANGVDSNIPQPSASSDIPSAASSLKLTAKSFALGSKLLSGNSSLSSPPPTTSSDRATDEVIILSPSRSGGGIETVKSPKITAAKSTEMVALTSAEMVAASKPSCSGAPRAKAASGGKPALAELRRSRRVRTPSVRLDIDREQGCSSKASSIGSVARRHSLRNRDKLYDEPAWFSTTAKRRSPYIPQVGDCVVYFWQGHELYISTVKDLGAKDSYPIDEDAEYPWTTQSDIKTEECCEVVAIEYVLEPYRLCKLKLQRLNAAGEKTIVAFDIVYHDVEGVADFVILKQHYDAALAVNWKANDPFQFLVENTLEFWRVATVSPCDAQFPDSKFMSLEILWDNGVKERLSAWDIEPFDMQKNLKLRSGCHVSDEEISRFAHYEPNESDWSPNGHVTETRRLIEAIDALAELKLSSDFVKWDAKHLEDHFLKGESVTMVAYPMDLSTIKARLENGFYRRLSAVQFDLNKIYENVADNCPAWCSAVCKARKLVRILTAFLSDVTCRDVNEILRSKRYRVSVTQGAAEEGSDSDDEAKLAPGIKSSVGETPRKARKAAQAADDRRLVEKIALERPHKSKLELRKRRNKRREFYAWEWDCNEVVEALIEMPESENFRRNADTPFELVLRMDKPFFLATVSERLSGKAAPPFADINDFDESMIQLFKNMNSLYGHDKESQDYLTKKYLWNRYKELFTPVFDHHTAPSPSKLRKAK